jgi:transcriptional regulator with XRE-family HTH domain
MPKSPKPRQPAAKRLGLGRKLAELRRSAGLTQEAAAALVPVSVPALIKIESGQRLPSDSALARLTAALAKAGAVKASQRKALELELLTRKYAEHRTSEFLRRLARHRLKELDK